MGIATAGAGLTGASMLANAYGQDVAMRALRKQWAAENERQAAFNQQVQAENAKLTGLTLDEVLGLKRAEATRGSLSNDARTVSAAIAKRGGGSGEAPPVKFDLSGLLRSAEFQSLLAGLRKGGSDVDLLGRQVGVNTGNIRRDAQASASLMPLREQAAQANGGWIRQLAQLGSTAGQGMMLYGMMQPQAKAFNPSSNVTESVQANLRPDVLDYQDPIDFTPDGLNPVRPYANG